MRKNSSAGPACSLLGVLVFVLASAAPIRAALTGSARLAAVYHAILAAQFDRAEAEMKQACPPAPVEACRVLRAVSLWWQIQVDPTNRSRDRQFTEQAEASISAADAWAKREPKSAEAWFYLAGAYAPLVQWQVLRGERLGAARNGNRVREALEQALKLDATLVDAQFGIGVYQYYADVAPAPAKLLRWFLFLPGGDRVNGLRAIEETSRSGELMRDEATFQLYQIDIWYERKPIEAIALLRSLDERYPTNPIFLTRIAETYDDYLHNARASVTAWQTLIDRARHDRVYDASRVITLAEKKRSAIIARDPKLF